MAGERRSTLILGIGNVLLRDEGVGVRAVEALAGRALPPSVEALDGGTSGADLIEHVADRRKLVVIDAMAADAQPGEVYRFGAADLLRNAPPTVSMHELGLLDTLQMASALGCAPKEVVVLGVQPKDVQVGLELSAEVAAALPRIVELALAEAAC